MLLGGILYWIFVVSRVIRTGEQNKAELLISPYAQLIEDAADSGEISRVENIMNQLMLLSDPETRRPIFLLLETELLSGESILKENKQLEINPVFFSAKTPLFSHTTDELIGTIRVSYNGEFYQRLLTDAREKLVWSFVIILLMLLLIQRVLAYLLKPLSSLVRHIDTIDFDKLQEMSPLSGNISTEIEQVNTALNDLMGRLGEARYQEEKQRKLRHEAELKYFHHEAELKRLTSLRIAKEYTEKIITAVPSILITLSDEFEVLATNKAYERLHEQNPSFTLEKFTKPLEKEIARSLKTGESLHKELTLYNEGTIASLTFTVVITQIKLESKKQGVLLTITDITDRKRAENELIKKERLLHTETKAINFLLTTTDHAAGINEVLAILGEAAEVDRAFIFEYHPHQKTGKEVVSLRFGWSNEPLRSKMNSPVLKNIQFESQLKRWNDKFLEGNAVQGFMKDSPVKEQKILKNLGINSLLAVPIIVNAKLIGFLGFGACFQERLWANTEKTILTTIAGSIGSAISRKQMDETIKHQAYHDALSGLPNRLLFNNILSYQLGNSEPKCDKMAIFFIDLDHFKIINDTLGHTSGDKLLKHVANILKRCLRHEDTVARPGGDEYTLLLPKIKRAENASKIAEKILSSIKEPCVIDGNKLDITASIGISLYPEDGKDANTLLKKADAAMYHAKEQGRNNFQFFSPNLSMKDAEQENGGKSLKEALERDEFILLYQPRFCLETGQITGMEALLRWNHPELGLILPKQIIPLAEQTGLIIPIGEWIIKTACKQSKEWQKAGITPICLDINLSAIQFQHKNLIQLIRGVLKETRLDPFLLGLELTENIAMRNLDSTVIKMKRLSDLGVKFSLDDFGSGHSSFGYFKKLPFKTLKIDRPFIRNLLSDEDNAAIVNAVIAMAHNLNIKVVAEGVETEEQAVL
ncbi:EAL domain-containing protein, partial [Acidobacteriota bacterium]